jgi:hypothetical protein
MSFVSNGGKFKLYTVLNGLLAPTPAQPRISFERGIVICSYFYLHKKCFNDIIIIKITYFSSQKKEFALIFYKILKVKANIHNFN